MQNKRKIPERTCEPFAKLAVEAFQKCRKKKLFMSIGMENGEQCWTISNSATGKEILRFYPARRIYVTVDGEVEKVRSIFIAIHEAYLIDQVITTFS